MMNDGGKWTDAARSGRHAIDEQKEIVLKTKGCNLYGNHGLYGKPLLGFSYCRAIGTLLHFIKLLTI